MLTEKQMKELERPFEFSEHSFKKGLVYIQKSAIRRRLSQIDPQWKLSPPEFVCVDGDVVIMRGSLTLLGVTRCQIGSGIIQRKTEAGANAEGYALALNIAKAYKSAATDILSRCAVEFNCGAYLKDKPSSIKEAGFEQWLAGLTRPPADPNAWTAENVSKWVEKWLAKDLTEAQLFKALGITELYREFKGTIAEADKAVEAFIQISEFDKPAQPKAAAVPKPVLDCPPHLLEEHDIIRQDSRDGNGNPQTTLYEVIHNWGKVGRDYKLELKNLATEEIKTYMWGGSDQTLCAGPKVEAYQKNPALCSKAKIGGYPQWMGQFAATG